MNATQNTSQVTTEIKHSEPTWQVITNLVIEITQYGFFYNMKNDSKFIQSYKKLYKEIKASEDPDEFIRNLVPKIYPNQETYDQKIANYKEWYKLKPLLLNPILKLHKIYYTIAKENFISLEEALKKAKAFLDEDLNLEPIDAFFNS
jgi:transcription termination factor NusB